MANIRVPEKCYGWIKDMKDCSDKIFLILINTERAKRAREKLQFLTVSSIFLDQKVGLIVKFNKSFSL